MTLLKTKLTPFFAILFLIFLGTSCSNDNNDVNNPNMATLSIKSNALTNGSTSRAMANTSLDITKFMANIEEIELEFDDDFCEDNDDDDGENDFDCSEYNGFYGSDDEFELQGPFEVDILTGDNTITTIDVPENVVFEELEFEFDTNNNPSSDLFGKSILIEGTLDGTPFVFWHDFEVDFEIDYEDSTNDIDINSGFNSVIISFDLAGLFNQIDLSNATDNNDDGTIEISPEDPDGNNELADQIKDLIEDYTDLLDD